MTTLPKQADICLFLEGTYPYVAGGVSKWTHDLISAQQDFTFYLVPILPKDAKTALKYELPSNVVGVQNIFLQEFPQTPSLPQEGRKRLFGQLELPLLTLQHNPTLATLKKILNILQQDKPFLNLETLLDSEEAWTMLTRMYAATMGETSFLNFFWSWRCLIGGFYSLMLADLPQAHLYHTFCTGYAGLMTARAKLETNQPCIITEHGIYTNERRIEITSADWLDDQKSMNLSIDRNRFDRDLKAFWIDTFLGYSKLCYAACEKIITLYGENRFLQIKDGAELAKLSVIPNGIDFQRLSTVERQLKMPPTVAFIGRVVPIKDVKTFIRALQLLAKQFPAFKGLIIGPFDEDEDYFNECEALIRDNHLEELITFTGKVNIEDYLPSIDIIVLSSVSEAQPLVLMEAGAAGIPCVATDVGACRELIEGQMTEDPKIGPGGMICRLSSPQEIADSIRKLLTEKNFYQQCSKNIQQRMKIYYDIANVNKSYHDLYADYISLSKHQH